MAAKAKKRTVSSLRAVAHPVRLQILSLLTGAELSAAEIARELGLTHANASYHLRVLASAGEVVEAGEEKIRGGVAKRYTHPWDRQPQPRKQPGGSWLADAEMWVAPEVWTEVVRLVEEAARLVHAEAKPPRTEGTIHVNLTAAAFEMRESER